MPAPRCAGCGAPAASGSDPYQQRPLATCPALRRDQHQEGICSASRAAADGPHGDGDGSGSVALTAST